MTKSTHPEQLEKSMFQSAYTSRACALLAAVFVAMVFTACGKSEDVSSSTAEPKIAIATSDPAESGVKVVNVAIGHTLDSQKRTADGNTEFGPKDSVYVSVETTGIGKSEIKVKYKDIESKMDNEFEETTQKVDTTGPAVSEFQIYHNGGWEPGTYHVEVLLDGKSVSTKQFTVK